MKKDKLFIIINWIFVIVTVIANIATYRYLPESMVIQVKATTGEATNQLSKGIYLLMVPIALLSMSLYTSFTKSKSAVKYFVLMTILFGLNIFTLYYNLK